MTSRRRPLVAANWKMNGSLTANEDWVSSFVPKAAALRCDTVVCAPFVYLCTLGRSLAPAELGAQDVSERAAGAFTGDVSAEMLADVGCRWVIVGHSERRQLHAETDAIVAGKAARALQAGLRPIVCVGETLADREAGRTQDVVGAQLTAVLDTIGPAGLARGALAYEPVWAIGTGRNATPAQAQDLQVHFADLLVPGGAILPSAALSAEAEEPEIAHLPRLVVDFNRKDFGMLRGLIDAINRF